MYSKHAQRIGRNKISIPDAFWKMYYNKDQDFQRCFYFKNKPEIKGKKIKDYEVDWVLWYRGTKCDTVLKNRLITLRHHPKY